MFCLKTTLEKAWAEITDLKLFLEQLTNEKDELEQKKDAIIEIYQGAVQGQQFILTALEDMKALIQTEMDSSTNEELRATLKRILNTLNSKL